MHRRRARGDGQRVLGAGVLCEAPLELGARGPVVSQPERIASVTAATSSSPTAGGWKPRNASPRARASRWHRRLEAYESAARAARSSASSRLSPMARIAPARSEPRRSGPKHGARLAVDPHRARPRARPPPRARRRRRARRRGDEEAHEAPPARGCRRERAARPARRARRRARAAFRSTPSAAAQSSASWPPPSRAASSTTCGPSAPTTTWVYVGPFAMPSASAAAARGFDRRADLPACGARPDVRERDAERGRLGDEPVGDRQRDEAPVEARRR